MRCRAATTSCKAILSRPTNNCWSVTMTQMAPPEQIETVRTFSFTDDWKFSYHQSAGFPSSPIKRTQPVTTGIYQKIEARMKKLYIKQKVLVLVKVHRGWWGSTTIHSVIRLWRRFPKTFSVENEQGKEVVELPRRQLPFAVKFALDNGKKRLRFPNSWVFKAKYLDFSWRCDGWWQLVGYGFWRVTKRTKDCG